MIRSLSISNYALIDKIELHFADNFNIITGETGAGKSIMLGALSMLLGARADTRVVADREKKSVVEATFSVEGYESLRNLLEVNDIDWDNNGIILRREIAPNGRSRSFVNDQPVQLTTLREIAMHLVDIHSQHQNLLLATPEYQLKVIDTLLPDQTPLSDYTAAYSTYRRDLRKYQIARRALENDRSEEEFLRFQLSKIEETNPEMGEQAELEKQREILSNSTTIKTTLSQLSMILSEGDSNILEQLRRALSLSDTLSTLPGFESLSERLESLRIEATDIAETVSVSEDNIEADPMRLEAIEQRLLDLYELQRRLGVENEEQLFAMHKEISDKLQALEGGEDALQTLATQAREAKRAAKEAALRLTDARQQVAASFAERLRKMAMPLGMKNLVVDIVFYKTELSPTGMDDIVFMFAFNKNQAPMPVKDTASGGEISRLMLVIKAIIAERMQLPSIIFDEIDTGVSGDIANRMGELMKDISRRIQVIAITHLPQVAAKGDIHFKVYKYDSDKATNTHVAMLEADDRVAEIALMISGDPENDAARATANSLLTKH